MHTKQKTKHDRAHTHKLAGVCHAISDVCMHRMHTLGCTQILPYVPGTRSGILVRWRFFVLTYV